MARTKNRGQQQPIAPTYTTRRWDVGMYIRLSKEDLKKAKEGKDDSNSVKNQRDMLTSSAALRNMWMTAIREQTPTGKIFNGSCPT